MYLTNNQFFINPCIVALSKILDFGLPGGVIGVFNISLIFNSKIQNPNSKIINPEQ